MVDQEDEEGPFEEFCMARLPAQNISIIDNASQQATNTSSIIENRKSDTTERRLNEIEIDKNKSLNSKELNRTLQIETILPVLMKRNRIVCQMIREI